MAKELETNDDVVRIAVVQYSDDVMVHFNLKSHNSKKAQKTGAALQFVCDRIFTTLSGSRHLEAVPQILFLLTLGKASDDVSKAALSFKQIGIQTFQIGLKKAKLEELQQIAFSHFLYNLPV